MARLAQKAENRPDNPGDEPRDHNARPNHAQHPAGGNRHDAGSVSTGFRAPTPGQQNGFNISTRFDPELGALVNNGTIPSISAVAMLRGGAPLEPETSVNYTLGAVVGGGEWTVTADYFRIDVSDRIGITSNFTLDDHEIAAQSSATARSATPTRSSRPHPSGRSRKRDRPSAAY